MRIAFKSKLILSYIFVVIISLGLIAFFIDKNLETNSLASIEASLTAQARIIASQIPYERVMLKDRDYMGALAGDLSLKSASRITFIDPDGAVLADSGQSREKTARMENHSRRPEVVTALAGGAGADIRYSPTLKVRMLYVAVPVLVNAKPVNIVRMALPLKSVENTLYGIRRIVVGGTLFAVLLAFVLGSIFSSRLMRPIDKIMHASRRFSEGDFSRRILHVSGDDIGELAATLNKMAEDIENKVTEISAHNQKLSAIFNSMIEGIVVIDKSGHIVSINPAVEKIFGVACEDARGRLLLEAIRNNEMADAIQSALEKREPVSCEITLVYPVRKVFEINATPVFNNDTIIGCVAVIHDITQIRRLETVRSDFVANVSHELKTPLTSIKGFIETLLDGALEDKANNRGFLEIIRDHAERLEGLINDLLTISGLESGEARLEKTALDLRRLTDKVMLGFSSQIKKRGIDVKNELPARIVANADEGRIEQVLTNLIDNAIKFNKDKGSVRIYRTEEPRAIRIIVEDLGIGIPERHARRIFERFYRVDKARSRSLGGTGLGLAIVKHIVELHGGTVGVESIEGHGSKFYFTLPK